MDMPKESGPRGFLWSPILSDETAKMLAKMLSDAFITRLAAARLIERYPMIETAMDLDEIKIGDRPIILLSAELIAACATFGIAIADDIFYLAISRSQPSRFLKAITGPREHAGKIMVRGYDRSRFFAPFHAIEAC